MIFVRYRPPNLADTSREHFRVTSCDVDFLFGVSHSDSKFFLTIDILNLIEVEVMFLVCDFFSSKQNVFKIVGLKTEQSFVVKIDVNDLLPIHSARNEILDPFI